MRGPFQLRSLYIDMLVHPHLETQLDLELMLHDHRLPGVSSAMQSVKAWSFNLGMPRLASLGFHSLYLCCELHIL